MATQLDILFMAPHSRVNSNGEMPIDYRITYNSQRKQYRSGCKVPSTMWDQSKQKEKGSSPKAQAVNQKINQIIQQIFQAEADLLKQGLPFEVDDIISRVLGKGSAKYRNLMEVYQYRFKQMQQLEGRDNSPSTLRKFKELANAVRHFILYTYDTDDIQLSKVNSAFLTSLELFLKTERNMKQISANKVMQKLKSIVGIAVENGWLNSNPFPGHRFRHERLDVIYLTVDELERLETYSFVQARLSRVRDMFLFSVFTGLHYTDAMGLTADNIISGVDGKEWIKYLRRKTNKWIHIPLLGKAKQLISKFKTEDDIGKFLVPRISNQKFNSYLKEIAEIVGINKPLTHKIARKTFGFILLYYNVPMKVVSELMGHSSVVVTEKHYAQFELKKLGEAMAEVNVQISDDTSA